MLKRAVIVIGMTSFQNLPAPICCVLGKDTLRYLALLGGLGKQSKFQLDL